MPEVEEVTAEVAVPMGAKQVLETLVQELKVLNHPLPLTEKKLAEWKE